MFDEKNLDEILNAIHRKNVILVGVTKQRTCEDLKKAYLKGLCHFGENYLQESQFKMRELSQFKICWHFIGRLQSNKIKYIVNRFKWIHSLDQYSHAIEISKRAKKPQKVLIQVNLSGEKTKAGVSLSELENFLKRLETLENIVVDGLMTMPYISDEAEKIRPYFRKLKQLQIELNLNHVSMGTSQDWLIAVEEGASMIRIGSKIFGKRT